MNFFLAPIPKNFENEKEFTYPSKYWITSFAIKKYLSPKGVSKLSQFDRVFMWGTKQTKETSWRKINQGDVVLFYKDSNFIAAGNIIYRELNTELARTISLGGILQPCLFFCEQIFSISLPISHIRKAGQYSDGFNKVQGFMPLKLEGNIEMQKLFKSFEDFVYKYT